VHKPLTFRNDVDVQVTHFEVDALYKRQLAVFALPVFVVHPGGDELLIVFPDEHAIHTIVVALAPVGLWSQPYVAQFATLYGDAVVSMKAFGLVVTQNSVEIKLSRLLERVTSVLPDAHVEHPPK
jgi:hypothetical protein